jgi:hypothetical protein
MTIAHIKRIILEELSKIIASNADANITKIDNKLMEYGISNVETRKLLIKKLISKGNISEALLVEDKTIIDALAKKIPTDPATLAKLRSLYRGTAKQDIDAAIRKNYLTQVYPTAFSFGTDNNKDTIDSNFRRQINKIVGFDRAVMDKFTQAPPAADKKPAKAPAKTPAKAPKAAASSKPAPKATPAGKTAPSGEPPAAPSKPSADTPPPKAAATPPKPKKKRKPFVMTPAKAKKLKQKYTDFVDGGDDKQISKKFTVSKVDKEKLPKFGKVGRQAKGGSEKQAATRSTSAAPFVSGEKPSRQLGDKGDSVPCLRGRKMDAAAKVKRETVGLTIMGGGTDAKGAPLRFGTGRWKDKTAGAIGNSPKKRQVADGKAIKSVLNFMGAAARFGYDPTKYWPNFLWATATDIVLKGQPKSKECGDPRNPNDINKYRKQQRTDKKAKATTKEGYVGEAIYEETEFDNSLARLPEDYCFEGCSDEQLSEASKRNVKNIPKYKAYVADLRQKSKGMNLDQFLKLIKYKG